MSNDDDHHLPIGDWLNGSRFEIISCLANGHLTSTYLGRLDSKVDVALKRISKSQDGYYPNHFFREVVILNFLNKLQEAEKEIKPFSHFVGMTTIEGETYIVTIYYSGPNLLCKLKTSEKTGISNFLNCPSWFLTFSEHIAYALKICHNSKIIYRDIHPGNIVFTSERDYPVLIDYGWSRFISVNQMSSYENNFPSIRVGMSDECYALWYRPPEVVIQQLDYGFEADIWAFGCLMFEVLTGQPLFPVLNEHELMEEIIKVSNESAIDYLLVRFHCAAGQIQITNESLVFKILRVISKCLEIEPEERVSAAEIYQGFVLLKSS